MFKYCGIIGTGCPVYSFRLKTIFNIQIIPIVVIIWELSLSTPAKKLRFVFR